GAGGTTYFAGGVGYGGGGGECIGGFGSAISVDGGAGGGGSGATVVISGSDGGVGYVTQIADPYSQDIFTANGGGTPFGGGGHASELYEPGNVHGGGGGGIVGRNSISSPVTGNQANPGLIVVIWFQG